MIEIYVMSAFSKDNQGGNKAGVVLNSEGLSETLKKEISAYLGYSETAYVSASTKADFHLEYFTPTDEVDLCGHATIATFSLLYLLKKVEAKQYTIETKAGILTILIKEDGTIMMQQNNPSYLSILEINDLDQCINDDAYDPSYPIQIVSTGLKDVIFPVTSLESLDHLQVDFDVMSEFSKRWQVIGVHAFTFVEDDHIDCIVRNFAPLYGINEESATGTANCALASYLYLHGIQKNDYYFEQGYSLQSISSIQVHLETKENQITSIYVGGKGYLVEMKYYEA